jgi:hypothetical protein
VTTYADLIRDIPIWLYAQNRDIVAEMPRLIKDAEDQIYNLIDHDLFQTVITGSGLVKDNPDLDISAMDIMEIRAIRIAYRGDNSWTPIERRNLEALTMMYSRMRPGRPRFYADYGNYDGLRFFPVPNADVQLEITANVAPEGLTDTNQTNILATKFPRVYEKAVLKQGALFMKNPNDAATYETEMQAALTEANLQIARRRRDDVGQRPVETANARGQ